MSLPESAPYPARSHRLRRRPSPPAMAGPGPHRGAVRPQLRGGRRELGAAWRRGQRAIPLEMFNPASYPARHLSMESIYEYGSRGRVAPAQEFEKRALPLTVLASAWRWSATGCDQAFVELDHGSPRMAGAGSLPEHGRGRGARAPGPRAMDSLRRLTLGRDPHGLGWYTGRDSPNTRRLVVDYGGLSTTATTTAMTCPSGCR